MLVDTQAILFPFEKEMQHSTSIISSVSYFLIKNSYKEHAQISQNPTWRFFHS